MEYRRLGQTDMTVSAVSLGAWAIGGAWGSVDDAESLRALHAAVDAGMNFIDTADVSQLALRWMLMFDAVSCAIPGARTPAQSRENAAAAALPALSPETLAAVKAVYDERIRSLVHESW